MLYCLNLGFTKSGTRKGAAEMVTIADPPLARLASHVVATHFPDDIVIGMSTFQYRTLFRQLIAALELEPLQLRPYSMRRGGASHHFLLHKDINTTLFMGRWDSVKTGRIYVVEGVAQLADMHVPPRVQERCLFLAERLFPQIS